MYYHDTKAKGQELLYSKNRSGRDNARIQVLMSRGDTKAKREKSRNGNDAGECGLPQTEVIR